MADLSAILNTMGRTPMGGYMAGVGFANYQQAQEAERKKLELEATLKQAEEARKAQMHPLDMDAKIATTEGTRATTGSTLENTLKTRLANQETTATQPGAIQATKAQNQGIVLKTQAERAARVGPALLQASALDFSKAQGPGAAMHMLTQFLEQSGAVPDNPMLLQKLGSYPVQEWPKALQAIGQTFVRSSSAFQQSMYEQEQSNKRNAASNATQLEASRIAANTKENLARLRNQALSLEASTREQEKAAAGDPVRLFSIYTTSAAKAKAQGDEEGFKYYSDLANNAKLIKAANSKLDASAPGGRPVLNPDTGRLEYKSSDISGNKPTDKKPLSEY